MKFYSKKLKKFFAMICAFCLIVEFSLSGIPVKAAEPTPKVTYTVTGEATVGKQITINLNVSNISGLYGGSWDFAYDPSILKIDEITSGELTSSIPQITTSNKSGHAYFWFTKTGDTTGVSTTEAKSIAKIKATVLKEGTININTTNSDNSFESNNKSSLVKLSDKNGDKISYSSEDKSILCVLPNLVLKPGKYEDNNSAINYVGNWLTDSSSNYSANNQKYSITPGNYFEFTFEGTGFNWALTSTSNRGIAKVTIDGISQNVDTYSASPVHKKVILSKTNLSYGIHTVRIEVTNNKNSKSSNIVQSIDFIEILNYSSVLKPGKYEDNNSAINYVGNWLTDSSSNYSANNQKYSTTSGNYFEFTFEGTGFNWALTSTSNRGIAKVTIDGISQNVDTYSASPVHKKVILSKTDLSYGIHTVRIEVTNNKNSKSSNIVQSIDFIEILNYSSVLKPGKYEDNNSAINYVGNWLTDSSSNYSANNQKYSTTSGNYFEFTFEGTGFNWALTSTSNRGIAKVTIDGISQNVDTYSASPVHKKVILSKTDLSYGIHTVRIEVTNNKNSKSSNIVQSIDFIEILNYSSVLKPGKYEDNNSAINYVGNWLTDSSSNYSANNQKYSITPGNYFEFTFEGTGFNWALTSTSNRGIAKVTIDGISQNVDTYSASPVHKKVILSKTDLSYGIHTVRIEVTNNKNFKSSNIVQSIDFIEVFCVKTY